MKFDRGEAARLREEGLSYPEIGRRLGVHHTTVLLALDPVAKQRWRDGRNARRRRARLDAWWSTWQRWVDERRARGGH